MSKKVYAKKIGCSERIGYYDINELPESIVLLGNTEYPEVLPMCLYDFRRNYYDIRRCFEYNFNSLRLKKNNPMRFKYIHEVFDRYVPIKEGKYGLQKSYSIEMACQMLDVLEHIDQQSESYARIAADIMHTVTGQCYAEFHLSNPETGARTQTMLGNRYEFSSVESICRFECDYYNASEEWKIWYVGETEEDAVAGHYTYTDCPHDELCAMFPDGWDVIIVPNDEADVTSERS